MPTTLIPIGRPIAMVQNQVYALPARVVIASSSGPIETSQDGTTFNAVTLTNNQATLAAQFIRATGATTLITLKV